MEYTNELIHETSPYLLQHAHNPVQWHPWGEKAFTRARKENKMMIVSVGYSSCHWCHVMAHESFEDPEVAMLMNDHFVCIKVDREERPDVDTIYISAAQLISGNAGWPLNAFTLPDGKPFFAATYFPKEKWIMLLEYFIKEYKNERKKLTDQAQQLSQGIVKMDDVPFIKDNHQSSLRDFKTMCALLLKRIDSNNGGLATNMKFPRPSVWEWLLEYGSLTGDKDALGAVYLTLDKMMNGGIYDQIGGGFARYATDPLWHAPHFEKMIFDNAQLISLYSHAYQLSKNGEYKRVVSETIQFLRRELSDGKAFFTALDADSEGKEGKYYLWTYREIKETLGDEARIFAGYFGATSEGNWEDGQNILDKNEQVYTEISHQQNLSDIIQRGKEKLLEIRNKRIRPGLDNKIITGWNALLSSGFVQAYRAFENREYYDLGAAILSYLLSEMWDENARVLYRSRQKEKKSVPGFLDDYAFFIKALIDFYQVSFDIHYLYKAKDLTKVVFENFLNSENKMFFFNDKRYNDVINRPMEVDDNVIPSSNSVMAENLYLLGVLFDSREFTRQSEQMLSNMKQEILKDIVYQTNWGRVLLRKGTAGMEVAVMGKDWKTVLPLLQQPFQPDVIYSGGTRDENLPLLKDRYRLSETMIYVCRDKTCQLPVSDPEKALLQIKKYRTDQFVAD